MWCIVILCEAKLPFTDTFQFVDLWNKNSTNLHCNLHEVQSSEQQFPASVGHSRQEGKENERPPLSSETLFCITADHIDHWCGMCMPCLACAPGISVPTVIVQTGSVSCVAHD